MNPNGGTPRFGFIVARTVGNAVTRNRVRRRLKACAFSISDSLPAGTEVVVRALPSASGASFAELQAEVTSVAARVAS